MLVLVVGVIDHLQNPDGAERRSETAKGRELVGLDLCHAAHDAGYLLRRWLAGLALMPCLPWGRSSSRW